MSLAKADVIDAVMVNPSGDTFVLLLVATEPWPPTGEGSLLLQAKLKNYVAFAADGQLIGHFPDARGRKLAIEIVLYHPLGETEEKLIGMARKHWCEPDGISLVVCDPPKAANP